MNEFKKLGLSKETTDILEELDFTLPTEIQEKTIPLILDGKDVIGNASTGSGKTLAFASGIIEKTIPGNGIQTLILTPTRELAIQIKKAISIFSKYKNLNFEEIYGGVDIDSQIRNIKKADGIIGTPGRVLDHLQRKTINFSKIQILVLDEADRMVDMGFVRDVEKIISQCNRERQTLLFSATDTYEVEVIAKKYMKNPIRVTATQFVEKSKLQQVFYDTPPHLKFSLLAHFLKKEKSGIVIIFCNTRQNVDMLTSNLKRHHINAQAIHGGLMQNKRNKIIDRFHNNEAEILVCTDVAARGLDIKNVSHVYNYDIPSSPDDYIHRIGRTARAGKEGMAVNIVSRKDYEAFWKIREKIDGIEQKEIPEVENLPVSFSKPERRSNKGLSSSRDRGDRGRGDNRGERRSFGNRDNRSRGKINRSRDSGRRTRRPSSNSQRQLNPRRQ